MQKSGFFNSNNGDRKYNADFFAEYFGSFIGNGVFPNPSTGLQVLATNNGYNITVKPGKGWINGYYYCNTTDYNIVLGNADGTLDRIDRVVLQFNTSTRDISIKIKKGDFSTIPVVKSIERNADICELALADVHINRGVITIKQQDITDLRLNKDLCGIVKGTVQEVDTTTLYNQYQAKFENKLTLNQQDFINWFNEIKGQLNGDLGATLTNKIINLETKATDALGLIGKKQNYTVIEEKLPTDLPSTYPLGYSTFYTSNSTWKSSCNASSNYAIVETCHAKLNYGITQKVTWYFSSNTITAIFERASFSSGEWGSWVRILDNITQITDLKTNNKTVIGAINEAFTLGNNVKNNTVNALLQVDNSLPISKSSSWNNIISNIGSLGAHKFDFGILTKPYGSMNDIFDIITKIKPQYIFGYGINYNDNKYDNHVVFVVSRGAIDEYICGMLGSRRYSGDSCEFIRQDSITWTDNGIKGFRFSQYVAENMEATVHWFAVE